MKTVNILCVLILAGLTSVAQVPDRMSFQAVVRDTEGELLKNTNIGVQISILQGSVSGAVVFGERHFPVTDAKGLITIEIGTGTLVNGNFSDIPWAEDTYFLKTEIDPQGGSDFVIESTSQLLSVPYAFYARSAGSVSLSGDEEAFSAWDKDVSDDFSGSYEDLTDKPVIPPPVAGSEPVFDEWDKSVEDDVKIAGDQTIDGTKTFIGQVKVDKPTEPGQAANKAYVDTALNTLAARITAFNVTCTSLPMISQAYTKLTDIGTFVKADSESIIEAEYNGRIFVANFTSGTGAVFELRVDDIASEVGWARAVYRTTDIPAYKQVSITGFFKNLSEGDHILSIWVRTSSGGAGTQAMVDPGCWSSDVALIKEYK